MGYSSSYDLKRKINASTDIVKQAWHALRGAAKPKQTVLDVFKMRKKSHAATITVFSPSVNFLDFSHRFNKNAEDSSVRTHGDLRSGSSVYDGIDLSQNSIHKIDEDQVEKANWSSGEVRMESEIDELADAFIARFHHKMRLEKQQSYRRYEDMLSRSA